MSNIVVNLNKPNLTASVRSDNYLANTELANAPTDAAAYEVTVYAVSSASGVNLTVQSAQETLVNDKEIISIGTSLSSLDHEMASFIVPAGAPLIASARETAGASTTDLLLRFEATPIDLE